MLRKRDTSRGFRPSLVLDPSITRPTHQALRLDGRLDEAALSPQIHQMILSMARLKNVVSSLRQEGEQVAFKEARRVLEDQDPETSPQHQVVRLAKEYHRIHATQASELPSFTVPSICHLHKRIFSGVDEYGTYHPGELKFEHNGIQDRSTGAWVFEATPPERTSAELEALFEWYKRERHHLPPMGVAALFFAEFQAIHPFHDGNGRIGRLINFHVLKQVGYENALLIALDGRFFRSGDRYYDKLRSTNDGRTWQIWTRFYTKTVLRAYNDALAMADFRPLLDSQRGQTTRDVLSWVLGGDGAWFQRRDYPNPVGHSASGISASLIDLVRQGILEAEGEKKGRRYRLATRYMERAFQGFLED